MNVPTYMAKGPMLAVSMVIPADILPLIIVEIKVFLHHQIDTR